MSGSKIPITSMGREGLGTVVLSTKVLGKRKCLLEKLTDEGKIGKRKNIVTPLPQPSKIGVEKSPLSRRKKAKKREVG